MKLYVVAPINDKVSGRSTYVWAEDIIQFSSGLGIETVEFIGRDVLKSTVNSKLAQGVDEPGLFCYLDHGHENSLLDSTNAPLIDSDNVHLLCNKFIYTVACNAGKGLGRIAVERGGAEGFLGYTGSVDLSDYSDYLNQAGTCLVSGLVGLLRDGLTAKQARERIEGRMTKVMTSLWRDRSAPYRLVAANSFRHNRDCLVLHGNENWKWGDT
jgi:hypothetical protein